MLSHPEKGPPPIDPFTIQEAETLILGIHAEWGEVMGNFDEFRFFTGLRQSKQIALRTSDCDLQKATIKIRRDRVGSRQGPHQDQGGSDRGVVPARPVSWHLMIGKNPLWCPRQHGHSVQVMYERYGTWIEGGDGSGH